MLGLDEEGPTEEIPLLVVNVTTRRNGPIMDESILLPKIRRIQENIKKVSSNTQTQLIPNLVITRKESLVVSKPVKVTESKMETNKKISTDGDMGNGIIDDVKKNKANISLFEMCNLPQQINKLLEDFDSQTSKS